MSRAMTITGLVISLLLALLFLLDLVIGEPFGAESKMMDIGFLVCALMLGYISWTTFKETN